MRLIPSVRLLLVPALFGLATLPALADDDCKHSRPMSLDPDLSGVDKVRFEIGPHELDLRGVEDNASVEAIACVSDTRYFDQLRLSQERRGDTLVIIAKREERGWEINFGRTYATLKVSARLPAGLDYEVDIGSGDASVRDVASLDARVASGDLDITGISGQVRTRVGSGEIEAEEIGSLVIDSIGSGDVEVRGVKGNVRVDSVGSGDLDLIRVSGDIEIGSIGSGDVSAHGVGGSVLIKSIGSGDAELIDVEGDVTVRSMGSGDVEARNVRGRVSLPPGH